MIMIMITITITITITIMVMVMIMIIIIKVFIRNSLRKQTCDNLHNKKKNKRKQIRCY